MRSTLVYPDGQDGERVNQPRPSAEGRGRFIPEKGNTMSEYVRCEGCQMIRINGIQCHEIGCPDAWKDSKRECRWCGWLFTPETKYQLFCDDGCQEAYFA